MLMKIVDINAHLNLLNDRNFMFEPELLNKLLIYTYIININITNVFV